MFKDIINEKLSQYIKATHKEKTAIVSSIVTVSGKHRKAVIRALNRERVRSSWEAPPKLGRPRFYTAETEAALARVWEQYDYPSAERLVDEIPEAVRIFRRDGMWGYCENTTNQLLNMSLGAMKLRTTALAKKRGLLRGQSTTKSGESDTTGMPVA